MNKLLICLIPTAALLLAGQSAAAADRAVKIPVTDVGVMLEVMSTGKCIDNAGSRKRGAGLQGWKCSPRNLNQRFSVSWHAKKKRSAAIRNELSGLCLDVQRRSKKDGARIVQNRCDNAGSQNWEFFKSGTGDWFLIQTRHSGLCLTLARAGKRDSVLIQTKCNKRNTNQKFKIRS